jgi:hypothetical protein
MSDAPSFSRARTRRSPLPVVVVVTMSLALLGGFMFDTARTPRAAQPVPAELHS